MKAIIQAATAAGALLVAGPAAAITLDFVSPTTGSLKPRVTIDESPVGPPGNSSAYGAFGFNMTGDLGDFIAYCIDLSTNLLSGPAEYAQSLAPFASDNAATVARVQTYYDANFGFVDSSAPNETAAFQLGLWETIYDDSADLSSGDFIASGANGGGATGTTIDSLADSFLSAASSYVGPQLFQLSFFTSTDVPEASQDLVAVNPGAGVTAIPLPAGVLLLGSALGAFGIAGRRRAA